MNIPSHIGTVLIGATFFSAGFASHAKDDCLILERKSVVGSDFADCMKASLCLPGDRPRFPEFHAELIARNLLNEEGRVHISAYSAVLADYLLKTNAYILMETETLSVVWKSGKYEVQFFNADGLQTITADLVIDTNPVPYKRSFRTLGAAIVNGTTDPMTFSDDRFFVQKGLLENEYILHLYLDENDNDLSAHLKMQKFLEGEDRPIGDWKVAAVASTIAWHYPLGAFRMEPETGAPVIPSTASLDPIAAMEGGVHYALTYTLGR